MAAVEIPALTARGIPLMVVGTANSVSVAEHAIFVMYSLAKKVMFHDAAVRGRAQGFIDLEKIKAGVVPA